MEQKGGRSIKKRIIALLMAAVLLLCLAGCKKDDAQKPTETSPVATEPANGETEHFDLSEIDLAEIGELFAQRNHTARYKVQLDGLCTPVVLELLGTELVSITAYDQKGKLAETVWYQGDREVERFTYTYDSKGGHTETFSQNGEKKYTYTFDGSGELIAHGVYKNGKEIKTKEYTYTVHAETYRYNDQGLKTETLYYADGQKINQDTFEYDANGYVLPSMDTYQYQYNAEGVLEAVWLIYEDWSAGAAHLRSRTVYVTPENARQLREILHHELSWF